MKYNIYDIKSLNSTNHIHANKVNNISQCNLLHDKINPSNHTKHLNIHYYPILHGCMDTHKGKTEFKDFRIILDSGCSYMIVMGILKKKLKTKE